MAELSPLRRRMIENMTVRNLPHCGKLGLHVPSDNQRKQRSG